MYPPDVEAEITFLTPEEGGRSTPVRSRYRPQFYYEGHDWDADHGYPAVDWIYPGQTVRTLRFLSPHNHLGRISPGMGFEIREGARVVGRGTITKILNLQENADRTRNQ